MKRLFIAVIVAMLILVLEGMPVMAREDYSTSDVQLETLQEQALGFHGIYITCGRWSTEDGETMKRTLYASIDGMRIASFTQWEEGTVSWFTAPSGNSRLSVKSAIKYLLTQRRTTITRVKSNSAKLYFYVTGTRPDDSISITFTKANGKVISKIPRLEMENGWQSVSRPKKAKTAIIRIYHKEGSSKKITVSLS